MSKTKEALLARNHSVALMGGMAYHLFKKRAVINELRHHARHDQLTGAYNRYGFFEAAEKLLPKLSPNQAIYMSFADLDNFKPFNDNHGHEVGDELLRQVYGSLKQESGPQDIVCRWGGDEFVILHVTDSQMADAEAKKMAASLSEGIQSLRQQPGVPWHNGDLEITIGQSDIYSGASKSLANLDELLKSSDQRMLDAKPHHIRHRA